MSWVLWTLVALLAMMVLYIGSMIGYFYLRKVCVRTKYGAEIIAILVPVFISFIAKIIIYCHSYDMWAVISQSKVATVFHTLYFIFGGLTFGGIDLLSDLNGFLQCLYYGTSLYVGIMFLSIITAKVSYEIFSRVQMAVWKLFHLTSKSQSKTDIYIFTGVTEDTIVLAKSIKAKYEEDKSRKRLIIFAGDRLEPFNRRNPLHKEIVANGFWFYSYMSSKKKDSKCSVLKRLKLYIKNSPSSKASVSKVHIFALNNNAELSGLELENSDIIFEEIEAILRETAPKKKNKVEDKQAIDSSANVVTNDEKTTETEVQNERKTVVDFYILTDNEINYELYQNRISSYFGGGEPKGFYLHLINEAYEIAKDFVKERDKAFEKVLKGTGKNLWKTGKAYNVMTLGFGPTGQNTLLQSYTFSTNMVKTEDVSFDENGKKSSVKAFIVNDFYADVYDEKMDVVSGLFKMKHPLCNVNNDADFETKIKDMYESRILEKSCNFEDFYSKMMIFPKFTCKQMSCFSTQFIEEINQKTNDNLSVSKKLKYDLTLVTLGDDERNIKMANLLLEDIKHELTSFTSEERENFKNQTIAINLRNNKNQSRINWTKKDEADFPNILVIFFGAKEDVYSYDAILDEADAMLLNHGYTYLKLIEAKIENQDEQTIFEYDEKLSAFQNIEIKCNNYLKKGFEENANSKSFEDLLAMAFDEITAYNKPVLAEDGFGYKSWTNQELANRFDELNAIRQQIINEKNIYNIEFKNPKLQYKLNNDIIELMADEREARLIKGKSILREEWSQKSLFDRESNVIAVLFKSSLNALRDIELLDGLNEFEKMKYFIAMEHERWNRTYIVNGWIYRNYSPSKKDRCKECKEHDCLLPFDLLENKYTKYDVINVSRIFEKKENK